MKSTSLVTKQKRGGEWKPAFLEALARTGNVTVATEAVGIDRTTAYLARKTDDKFAAAWKEAKHQTYVDRLEAKADELAMTGDRTMLIFLLKGNRPEKYRDYAKIDHNVSGSLDINIVETGMSDIEKGE